MKRNVYLFVYLLLFVFTAHGQFFDCYFQACGDDNPLCVRVDTLHGLFAIGVNAIGGEDDRSLSFPDMYGEFYICDGDLVSYLQGSFPSINVGGEIYRSHSAFPPTDGERDLDDYFSGSVYDPVENQIVSRWIIPGIGGGINFRQFMSPTSIEHYPMIEIKYELENTSIIPLNAGLKLVIDPMLAGVDNVEVSVGPYYTDVGVLFEPGDVMRDIWQAYEEGWDAGPDQLIARGYIDRDIPEYFGLGNAVSPWGIKQWAWLIYPEDWVDDTYVDCCAMFRWDLEPLGIGATVSHVTYYGLGDTITGSDDWLDLIPLYSQTVGITDCNVDTIFDATFTNAYNEIETAHNVTVCLDFPVGSPFIHYGDSCIVAGDMNYLEAINTTLSFIIPHSYAMSGPHEDFIYFRRFCDESPYLDTLITVDTVFIPFFEALPPEMEFVDDMVEFVNCSTNIRIYTFDTDTSIRSRETKLSLNGISFSSFQGIFSTINDTIYLSIDSMLITTENDTFHFGTDIEYCVTNLEDEFGCTADTTCASFTFDFEGPYIIDIVPPPGSAISRDDEILYVQVNDDVSGIDSSSVVMTVGITEYNLADPSPELAYNSGTGRISFDPSGASLYADGESLLVCLNACDDNVTLCRPNQLQAGSGTDSCWYYWVDFSPPSDATIIRPTISDTAIACETLDTLTLIVKDASGILLDSLYIDVNGTLYRGSDCVMHLGATSVDYDTIFLVDRAVLIEGVNVVSVSNFYDSLGNYSSAILSRTFEVDWTPPTIGMPIPPDMSSLGIPPTCSIQLYDNRGPEFLDIATVELTADGFSMLYGTDYFYAPADSQLHITLETYPGLEDGDTVEICITDAADLSQYCDGANHIAAPYCWSYIIDARVPEHRLLTPFDGAHVACDCELPIEIEFRDDAGVNPIIELTVGGESVIGVYTFVTEDIGTLSVLVPGSVFTDCEETEISVVSVSDLLGNAAPGSTWTVIPDCSQPEWVDYSPDYTPAPHDIVTMTFNDECSEFFRDSTRVSILIRRGGGIEIFDTVTYDDAIIWDETAEGFDSLYFTFSDIGLALENGDTIRICIDKMSDSLTYIVPDCGYNVFEAEEEDTTSEFCFSYVVTFDGPVAQMIQPPPRSYIACRDFPLIFTVQDSNGIEVSTLHINIDGTDYYYDDFEDYIGDPLDELADTIVIADPGPGSWRVCDTIRVLFNEADDLFGTGISIPVNSYFIVDTTAPTVISFMPATGGVMEGTDSRIRVVIRDPACGSFGGAGVRMNSLVFTVDGLEYPEPDHDFVYWRGDTAIFDIAMSGLVIAGGDSVDYCVRVNDRTADFREPTLLRCVPNELDQCSWFTMSATGPVIEPIFPAMVVDHPCYVISCGGLDSLIIRIDDSEGVDWSSLVLTIGADDYSFSDGHLLDENIFVYVFSPRLTVEAITDVSVQVSDVVGNPSALSYCFSIDNTPPEPVNLYPACGDTIDSNTPVIEILFSDAGSMVDTSSVCVAFCTSAWDSCDTFCMTDSLPAGAFSWSDSILSIDTEVLPYFVPGGAAGHFFVVSVCDVVDTCDANCVYDVDSCEYIVSALGPVVELVPPVEDGWAIGCPPPFCFNFTISDIDGVVEGSLRLYLYTSFLGSADYGVGSVFSRVAGDTFSFCPEEPFTNEDSISISFEGEDALGNPISGRVFTFSFDNRPPGFISLEPPLSGAETMSPDIVLEFPDFTGPDTLSPTVTLSGPDAVTHTFTSPDPAVSWSGDSMIVSHGFRYATDDTITICVDRIVDAVDTCSNETILDSCWQVVIIQGGPIPEWLTPVADNPESLSCPEDCYTFRLTDTDGVIESTLVVLAEGDTFRISDPELTYEGDSLLTFCPETPVYDAEYTVTIDSLGRDGAGYPVMRTDFTYYRDVEPPVVSEFYPADSAEVYCIPVHAVITDGLNDLDTSSFTLTLIEHSMLDTTSFDMPGGMLVWDGVESMLHFNDDSAYCFSASDSVTVCIGASDITGCDLVNAVDTCFQFIAPFGEGPRPSLLSPEYNNACVSCETPFRVITLIASDNALADTSLQLHFTSTFGDCDSIYTIDSPEVTLVLTADSLMDTLYFDIPAACYNADAIIHISIDRLNDIFGNANRPYSVNFHVDWDGPLAEVVWPTAPISDLTPDIRIAVWDSGCGINHTTPEIEVTTPGGPTYSYVWGDAPLSWAGDTLIFSTPDSLGFAGSDIVHICLVHQFDTVDVSLCEANDIDTAYCFDVVINGDGPMPYLISPYAGDIVTCECPEFIFAFDDSDGVDESTIEIQIGDEILTGGWTFRNDSVFIPAGTVCFEDGELVTIEILAADDMLRNPVLAGFTWDITIDLTPPYADSLVPPAGSFVFDDRAPLLGIFPRDLYSGILETTAVRITLDGIEIGMYDMEHPALTFDPSDTSFWFDISMTDMDSLCEYSEIGVEFIITDYTGDSLYCPPNDTVIGWTFQIGDDDTLGPEFMFDSTAWPAYSESLVITVHIFDTSGVYDDETTMDGQGIYVEIDTTDDGIWNADTFLAAALDSGDLYTTVAGAFPYMNLTEGMHFCFRVVAYDNDFDCENTIDRHSAISEEYCYQIYNIIAPALSILMPQDSSHYSCLCDSQEISFVLLDPDRVVLDNMVISINGVNYYYPDSRITTGGVDITREVYWSPQPDECFDDGERVDVRVWGYSDIYLNFPEDTMSWTFIADQSEPTVTIADTSTRLYADEVHQIALYVNDPDGEIDPARIQVQVSVNDVTPVILTEADYPALRYEPEADSLYIDVRSLSGYTPTARDSIFIDVIEICDNAIGCGPNCFSGLRFFKFIKYETFCSSHPKPFTPNGDHINDVVQIEYPKRFDTQATVTITDLNNTEIQKVEMRSDSRYLWDGTDSGGHPCRQGVYIFAVEVEGEVVCTGTIVLAR